MALNLSTLTSPATSGDVLAEALTTADFLESCPVLRNLSRGSNKGGDAKQDVALNQPKALPLIDGDGYLYCSGVSGNCALVPDESALDVSGDLTIEIDVTVSAIAPQNPESLLSKYNTTTGNRSYDLALQTDGKISLVISSDGSFQPSNSSISTNSLTSQGIVDGQRITIKATWRQSDGRVQFFYKTRGGDFTQLGINVTANAGSIYNSNTDVNIGAKNQGTSAMAKAAIHSAKIYASINDTNKVLDADFTATNVRHGDTKFKCATGQVVTINQSGNDPATVIKKSVLRFDGVNDGLNGLLNQTITGGYMFTAFSVLGSGGETAARVFGINSAGANDNDATGAIFSLKGGTSDDLRSIVAENYQTQHIDLYNSQRGDILHERKISNGAQFGKVNNADAETDSVSTTISAEEFALGFMHTGNSNRAALDLEFLAVFPASITDDQADSVRNYINNRNLVFDLKDGFGYYFYDAQKAPVGAISSGSSAWNGRIVGSDNGDADKLATQATANDQPVSDGYVVTFADNTDHLDIPSTSQAGWQVVGTSLGTFAYRVNANAVTELNLLGNAGSHRSVGDSFGMLLLPESATGADIEQARKLLIDRGAADGTTASSYNNGWFQRFDITEFNAVDFTGATNFGSAWRNCYGLLSFNAPALPSATDVSLAWNYCLALTDFRTTEIPNCTNFTSAWQNCSALTSFPAGAKLGTSASNVNFTSAWQQSGLTSFSTPLPTATNVNQAWYQCALLTSFSSDLSAATTAKYAWLSCTSLTSFDTPLPSATQMLLAWHNCSSLTSFSSELPLAANANQAWLNCTSLTDFSADVFANWNPSSITTGVFNLTWDGCTSLTAQSVENILTSIDASGKYATTNGASGGTALGDAAIDIDYNTATGSLSAATNSAVDSLKAKGWSIIVNNVTL